MLYMVQGYIFMSVYNFVRTKENELNHLFFKSVVISYVLKATFDLITPWSCIVEGSVGYIALLCLFSALLAILLALVTQSSWFNNLLLRLHIRRTTNQNIWKDVIRPDCWLMVYPKDSECVYYGKCKYNEEFARKPIIVLEYYQAMDYEGNIIEDNIHDANHMVLIDTQDIERVEIVYE